MSKPKIICIAGGHLSPAIAVAEVLTKIPNTNIVFIGRNSAFGRNEEKISTEKVQFQKFTETIHLLDVDRVTLQRPLSIFTFLKAIMQCVALYKQEKPDVIIVFGGYIGMICGIAGILAGVPFVIHEQTHSLGRANKILSPFAKLVCVSFPDMAQNHQVFSGLPLRQDIIHPPTNNTLALPLTRKILYITGGTTGAVSLNDKLFGLIPTLLQEYTVVHQTGQLSYKRAEEVKKNLEDSVKDFYRIIPYIDSRDASWLLYNSTVIIARGGANTVYELAVSTTPAIIVPLPWSAADEQSKNAAWLSEYSAAICIPQQDVTDERLLKSLETVVTISPSTEQQIPIDGASRLVDQVLSVIS